MAGRGSLPRRPRRPRRVSRSLPPSRPRRVKRVASRWKYARLEVDLVHEAFERSGLPFVHRLEAVFREREVVEVEGLLRLSAAVLHALAERDFSRVDHWEVFPGGWLPLPEPVHERLEEPVGHLLNALRSEAWKKVAGARSFRFRLSGAAELRADVTVRRVHREWGHAITLELFGPISERELRGYEVALNEALTVARIRRATLTPT
jgi:hypothetical protein